MNWERNSERKSIRWSAYNYALGGIFFITICAYEKRLSFAKVTGEAIRLSGLGRLIRSEWLKTGEMRDEIELGEFVIMPNHFHALLKISLGDLRKDPAFDHERARNSNRKFTAPVRGSLGSVVSMFKASTTTKWNTECGTPGNPVWQRGYFDHVVRDEDDFDAIRHYIKTNPSRWIEDVYYG